MKKYFWIIFATLTLAGSSCRKDFLNLEQNPNVPTVTTPGLSLSGALKTTADIVNGLEPSGGGSPYVAYNCWVGYMSWSTGFQPNVALLSYQITSATYDGWTSTYINIANYQAIINSTTDPEFQAISKIMIAFDYEALVDNYNNVPYSQAIKGVAVLNPTYDNGQAIYTDLTKQLDAAILMINTAPSSSLNPGTSDIMYHGNMRNWAKFANTLKLRIALRQSNITANTATLKADALASDTTGYIDVTNPAVVNPGYSNSDANGGQESPLWRNYGYTQGGGSQTNHSEYQANTYGSTKLSQNGDVRAFVVYTVNSSDQVVSTAFGSTTPPSGGTPSTPGSGVLKAATMNANVLTSAESLFIQAEAAKDGYITGDPGTLYNAGITASYLDDGLTTGQANTYIALNPYPASDDATNEQAIIDEKWKALAIYGGFEAFNEYRRTGYPNDIPLSVYPGADPPNNVTRIPYPATEYRTNAGPVAAQGTINVFTSKIFWAK